MDKSKGANPKSGGRVRRILLFLVILFLLGYSGLATVAYWKKDRDSRTRISHLEKEVKSRSEQMNRMLKDSSGMEASLAEMEKAMSDLRARQEQAEQRIEQFRMLLQSLKSLRDAGDLEIRIVDGRAVIALPFDILFASGSSSLSDAGKARIRKIASILAPIKGHRFQVEGHTDSDPIARPGYTNWELASDRSLVVLHTMIAAGMPPERISAASFGPTHPIAANSNLANKAKNRRIEIVLLPDLSVLPGSEEMQQMLAGE